MQRPERCLTLTPSLPPPQQRGSPVRGLLSGRTTKRGGHRFPGRALNVPPASGSLPDHQQLTVSRR